MPLASEFAIRPHAVVTHDPVAAGAIALLDGVSDASELRQHYLFRERPDQDAFAREHAAFVAVLREYCDTVIPLRHLIDNDATFAPAHGNPNQVYTRDSAITIPWVPDGYLPARMLSPIRHPEPHTMAAALARLGLHPLVTLPAPLILEGGDVIPFIREGRRALLVGFGRRTTRETLDYLQQALIPTHLDEVIGIELASWRINLDGGMVPVAEDVILAHPESLVRGVMLDRHGTMPIEPLDLFRDLGFRVISVSLEESLYQQACNCFCLGDRRLVCYDLCGRAVAQLREHDIEPITVSGAELVKGTGGPRCMTRPIYRAVSDASPSAHSLQ